MFPLRGHSETIDPTRGRLEKDVYEAYMDEWRGRMYLFRWIRMCVWRRKTIFNNFKAEERLRYKRIILPMATTRLLRETVKYWRLRIVSDRCKKLRYFSYWKQYAAAKMVGFLKLCYNLYITCIFSRLASIFESIFWSKGSKDGFVDRNG